MNKDDPIWEDEQQLKSISKKKMISSSVGEFVEVLKSKPLVSMVGVSVVLILIFYKKQNTS